MYRIPRLAVAGCATLFLLGCESPIPPQHSITEPASPALLTVEIIGPSQINAEGTYSWEAFVYGGSGAYQYQWDVTRHASGAVTTVTQRNVTLHVVRSDGDFSLKLTLTSGADTRSQNLDVTNCISACRYSARN